MNKYNDIAIWENARRIEKLIEFRHHIFTYFNYRIANANHNDILASSHSGSKQPHKEVEIANTRSEINMMTREIDKMITAAEVPRVLEWGMLGHTRPIDLINDLFSIEEFDIPPSRVTDVLEQAIGVYQTNINKSFIRTFNPIWWIWRCFRWFARIPFLFIYTLGFNASKFEDSIFGLIIKSVFTIFVIFVLEQLDLLGIILEKWQSYRDIKPIDTNI